MLTHNQILEYRSMLRHARKTKNKNLIKSIEETMIKLGIEIYE